MFIFFWELNIFHDDVLMFKTAFGHNDTGDNDIGDGDGDGDDDMGKKLSRWQVNIQGGG